MIETGLAEKVLARALERGGDLAELFCERRQSFGLSIDESRIEHPQGGGEAGAGVRVVSGATTYFAHVDGLAEPDLLRAAGAPPPALAGDRRELAALTAIDQPEPHPIAKPPERSRPSARPSAARARRAGAGARPGDRPAAGLLRRRTAPGRGLQLGRARRPRRPHPGAARRPGRGPPQRLGRDRLRDPRRPPRLRAARRRPGRSPSRRRARRSPCSTPTRRRPARCPSSSAAASAASSSTR